MKDQLLTKETITAGLRAFGVLEGAGVMVHSSLRSFGYVAGGARTVVEALMSAVTPRGILLMPSFNHGAAFEPGAPGIYDPRETPTTDGAIPEAFWRMPGVQRSLDPTHPFAAWGQNAERYIQNHHLTLTMGLESPLGLLWQDGGLGLLLGVDFHANTFHHVVEMTTGAPCLGRRSEAYPVRMPDGRIVPGRTWGWREKDCPITDSASYAEDLFAIGLVRERRIGACRALLFRLQDCYEVVAGLLQSGKNGHPPCRLCPIRPGITPYTV